ncbi:Lsr2 family DNA-binding protein [Streptomyces geranii]|uniref:Lsr2 family DNA-binding protein n=1 Tax=Streptomyces geranii TaxID=2058923 RepID=UPI000D02ABD4|nr:Lsr2 family protein [Streptomyces geranii]
MGGKFTDWAEALDTSALTLEPESEDTAGHDAAVSRLVARNARDKDDLADLLDAIGLPGTEDDLVPLLALLPSPTDHPATGDPMTTSAPTTNAFFAVAVSMLKEGTDIATVLETVDLSEAELAEALALAGRPDPDTQPAPGDTTPPSADADGDAPGATQEEAGPADAPAPTEPADPDSVDGFDSDPACDRTEELLVWGEQHDARSRHLAAQARDALAELARRRGNAAVIDQAKAKVAALENELARAREELQQAVGGEDLTAVVPAVPALAVAPALKNEPVRPRGDRETIRRWAKANGLRVADRGALSNDVVIAYNAVHNGAAFAEVG